MFNNIRKALFKFHASWDGSLLSEKTTVWMLCVYELQFASFFSAPAHTTSFDSPIIYLISLINFFGAFGITENLSKLLLITFTVCYALALAIDFIGIKTWMNKRSARPFMLQKISATLFVLQKHLLLIPALAACSSALRSDSLLVVVIGGVLLAFVCIYNLSHSLYKIILPYSKAPFANLNSLEETIDFSIQLLTAFLSTYYVRRYFINSVNLLGSGAVSLGLSVPFLVLCLLRTAKLMVFPTVNERKHQIIHMIFSLSSFYVLVEQILSDRGVASSFPALVILSLLVKVILNCQELMLTRLFNILQTYSLKGSALGRQLGLRALYIYFESIKDQPHDIMRVTQVLLTEIENKDIFSTDQSETVEVCEARIKSDLRPQLIKFIERHYSCLTQEMNSLSSFSIRVSYIQFLSEISGNKSKALQLLFETRQIFRGRLPVRNQITLKAIQKSLTAGVRDKFHLREVLDVQQSYQNHVKRAQELVSIRAEILARLVEPGCDLDLLKKLSVDFSEKGERLINDLQKNLDSNCKHLQSIALHDYIQICLYEMSISSKSLKLEAMVSKMKAFNMEEENQIPQTSLLMNLDEGSRLSYIAFSLTSKKLGEGIVLSKNFRSLLGFPDEIIASKITIENIFPSFLREKVQSLVTEASENGSKFENSEWSKAFLQKVDGSLVDIKLLMTIEAMQNDEIALVLYIYQTPNPLNGFLFNEGLEAIGFTNLLLKSLAAAAKVTEAEAAAHLLQLSSLKQFFPTFDPKVFSDNTTIDFECDFDFSASSSRQKSSDSYYKQNSPSCRFMLLSGTISKNRLSLFDAECFTAIITHAGRSRKQFTYSTTSRNPQTKTHLNSENSPLMSPWLGLNTPLEEKTLGDPTPTEENTPLKLLNRLDSKESDTDLDTENKKGLTRSNRPLSSEKHSSRKNREHEESSQLSSSLLNSKRKRIKQMISSFGVPKFLLGVNFLGHISVLGLIIMIVVSYVILSKAYDEFAQYAEVAPFPSYLKTVVKSVYSNVEQAVILNSGYYPTSTANRMKSTVAGNFGDKVQRFLLKFDEFMVNYDVEKLSPSFNYNSYEMSVNREGIYDTPKNLSIYEASKIFLGVIYKVNKTDFSQFNSDLQEVKWLRKHSLDYLQTYENMRATLYSDFKGHYQSILQLFDVILGIGATVAVVIVAVCILVWRSTEQRKLQLMRQVLTIPRELVLKYLETFQSEYKAFFGTDITIKNVQLPSKVKEKNNHNQTRNQGTRMTYKIKRVGMVLIAALSMILIIYVMAFYAIANIYFKQKTNQAIPYIDNIDMQSRVTPYSSMAVGLTHQLMSTYNQTEVEALIPTVARYFEYFKELRDKVVKMMQVSHATLFTTTMQVLSCKKDTRISAQYLYATTSRPISTIIPVNQRSVRLRKMVLLA